MTFFSFLLTAFAGEGSSTGAKAPDTVWMPPSASTLADDVDSTFYFIYWTSAVFFVVLMGAMFYFAVAYKRKGDDDRTLDLKGSHTIEIAWSVFPSFLLIAMFAMGFKNYMKSVNVPADSLAVKVIGEKWLWSFDYPNLGIYDSKTLVVPNKSPVSLQMFSKDVLHSFYIPDFRIKKDVVPNRYTSQWFETKGMYLTENIAVPNLGNEYSDWKSFDGKTAEEFDFKSLEEKGVKQANVLGYSSGLDVQKDVAAQCAKEKAINPKIACSETAENVKYGVHQIYCTEYCGDHHSRMLSKVVVLEAADFGLWVKAQKAKANLSFEEKYAGMASAEIGKAIAEKKCLSCHSTDGTEDKYPTWKGLFGKERTFSNGSASTTADETYIMNSVRTPSKDVVSGFADQMTPFPKSSLGDKELDAIIEYIKTLK